MAWRPSQDTRLERTSANSLWGAIETAYDDACSMASLERHDHESLDRDYVHVRKADHGHDSDAMISRLPAALQTFRLGPTDVDLIDFLLNITNDRVLNLLGFRGAGKTTLLRYVESVTRRTLPRTFPIFILVDCLALDDNATVESLVKKLELELAELAGSLSAQFARAFRAAVRVMRKSSSSVTAQEAMSTLLSHLPAADRSRIFVVFDNLDHLHVTTVSVALELAKALVVSSGVGCVTCLRPGSLTGAFGHGDAQAFFALQIRVYPPDIEAWLTRLAPRVELLASKLMQEPGVTLAVRGEPLDSLAVRHALDRFTKLLHGRPTGDDPVAVLSSLAAD